MAKTVALVSPVEYIERVARVIAVAIQRFGAQDFLTCMEISHTLAEGHQGASKHLNACALGAAGAAGQLVGQAVVQAQVVMVLCIVHHLTGLAGVTSGLIAVWNVL